MMFLHCLKIPSLGYNNSIYKMYGIYQESILKYMCTYLKIFKNFKVFKECEDFKGYFLIYFLNV